MNIWVRDAVITTFQRALFYDFYHCIFSLALDIVSHWLHLHVSVMKGSSHKSMGLDSNPIMKLYYTSRVSSNNLTLLMYVVLVSFVSIYGIDSRLVHSFVLRIYCFHFYIKTTGLGLGYQVGHPMPDTTLIQRICR